MTQLPAKNQPVTLEKRMDLMRKTIPSLSPQLRDPASLMLNTTKIASYTQKTQFRDLDLFLLAYSKFLGINPAPEKDERLMIISFLKENFEDFSKEEIEKAFNMALAFKLDIPIDQLNTYNKLTPLWISTILYKYRSHRSKALKEMEEILYASQKEEQSKISEKEADLIMLEAMKTQYNNLTNKENPKDIVDLGASIWSWLQRKRNIWSSETINQYVDIAVDLVKAELNGQKMNTYDTIDILDITREIESMQKRIEQNEKDTGKVYYKARYLMLKDLFTNPDQYELILKTLETELK